MNYLQTRNLTSRVREFSLQSLLFAALFIITLIAAASVDLTGVLEYAKVISGSSISTMELGAIITTACCAPFLAMGFSMAADFERNSQDANEDDR